jgi:hypothetical protein
MRYHSPYTCCQSFCCYIITEAFEESFSFDEFEASVIENVAAVPIFVGKSGKAKSEILDQAKAG